MSTEDKFKAIEYLLTNIVIAIFVLIVITGG